MSVFNSYLVIDYINTTKIKALHYCLKIAKFTKNNNIKLNFKGNYENIIKNY